MRKPRKYLWAGIAFLTLFALLYTQDEITLAGNESTRFGVIQAVAEQGVFQIENTNFASTVDKVEKDGHIYSDKPLPLAFSAAVVYGALHRATGINFTDNRQLSIYLVNLLFAGGCNLLLFCWCYRFLRREYRGRIELKFLLAVGLCASTWLLSYSVIINNHTPAALAGLGLVVALAKFRRKPGMAAAVAAGLAAGIGGMMELPCGLIFGVGALAGIYLETPGRKFRPVLATAGAGLFCALLWMLLNHTAYSTVLPLYVAGGGGTYRAPFTFRLLPEYAFQSLLGFRGLFSYQPFLLLVFPAVWLCRKRFRPFEWVSLAMAAGILLFYLVFSNEYGGAAYGVRYYIAMIPLLWLPIARLLLETRWNGWKGAAVALLLLWGVVTSMVGAYCPFCLGNEGPRSPEGHFTRVIASSFWGNVLVMSFDRNPEGALTQKLIAHYGEKACFNYLYVAGVHMRKPDLVAKLLASPLGSEWSH